MSTVTRHEPGALFNKVVEANGFVFTAGVVADDLTKDVRGQTMDVLEEIDRLLALCGSDKSKIVSATIWVTDIRNRDAMNEAWTAWTGKKDLPVRACIEARLATPDMLVEIQVTAVK
ncbi:MAG: RidA family protein [Pseudomonadota bacterium]